MKFSDKEFAFEEDNFYVNGLTARILRADVARYMIKTLEDDLHHKKIVAMGTKWKISIFFEIIVFIISITLFHFD